MTIRGSGSARYSVFIRCAPYLFGIGTLAILSACSAPASSPETKPSVATASSVDDAAETARIQGYLDSIYTRDDVQYTFKTKHDQSVDCIDFYAQPAVRAMIAQGQHVEIPIPPELPEDKLGAAANPRGEAPTPSDDGFNGQPDVDGNARQCPDGTVPFFRKTVAGIKALGGLDPYLMRLSQKPRASLPPPTNPDTPDDTNFMHVAANMNLSNGGTIFPDGGEIPSYTPITGGFTTVSVYAPSLDADGLGHTLAQTWVLTGSNISTFNPGAQCTSNCYQSIELGWTVDPSINTLNGETDSKNPHIFIYSTQDGYWNTGCYNTGTCTAPRCAAPSQTSSCAGLGGLTANPFVTMSGAEYAPEAILTASTIGQIPKEINFTTMYSASSKAWFVYAYDGSNHKPMGYWPGSAFHGQMQTTANLFQAGGEVTSGHLTEYSQSNPPTATMGSGLGAPVGYELAAYHRNMGFYQLQNGTTSTVATSIFAIYQTDQYCYSQGAGFDNVPLVGSPAPPSGKNWGDYLFFGGAGQLCIDGLCTDCCVSGDTSCN